MDQRQGRPAEKLFSLLCSQVNITCNKSDEDDHGWDFIVEVPMSHSDRLPADKVGQIRKIEVQIKDSNTSHPKAKLKVSNARSFAMSDLPCFIVVVQDANTKTPRIFIRHFWKAEMTRALMRSRELGSKNKPLNRSHTQFTLTDEEDRSEDPIGWLVRTSPSLT